MNNVYNRDRSRSGAGSFDHQTIRPPAILPWFPHDIVNVFRDPPPPLMHLNLTSEHTPPPPPHVHLNMEETQRPNSNRKRSQGHENEQQAKRRRVSLIPGGSGGSNYTPGGSNSTPGVSDHNDDIIEINNSNNDPADRAETSKSKNKRTNKVLNGTCSQQKTKRSKVTAATVTAATVTEVKSSSDDSVIDITDVETGSSSKHTPPSGSNKHFPPPPQRGPDRQNSSKPNLRPLFNDAVSLPRNRPVDRLTDQIYIYFNSRKQQQSDLCRKQDFLRQIHSEVDNVYPGARLFIVGSSMNGFGSRDSDMDLCLLLNNKTNLRQKNEVLPMLRKLAKRFRRNRQMRKVLVIPATVPIIKFDIGSNNPVEVDLNIDNTVSLRNTHLLLAYSRLEPRVAPLVFAVKYLSRALHINDAKEGTLSSYSLALMTINYLQVACDPPVLPSLQQEHKNIFSKSNSVDNLPVPPAQIFTTFKSHNSQSIGELLLGFFYYYGFQFQFERDIMSVCDATRYPRAYSRDKEWTNKRICIEEPFERTNTARAVWSADKYEQVLTMFQFAHNFLARTHDLNKLLSGNPLLEYPRW